jgi:type I restriction-modification system DNA methylase subunit
MTDISKNTELQQSCITAVMPRFYYFDANNRVYEVDGIRQSSPYYEKHFTKINVIEETNKEFICQYGRTINKRSMLYKIDNATRKRVYTEQEKEDDIYVNSKAHKLAELVRKADVNTLREIERLLNKA